MAIDVDWSSVQDSNGRADEIPGLIEESIDRVGDPDFDDGAMEILSERLNESEHHLFEASAYAVPVLLGIVADQGVVNRSTHADLVLKMAETAFTLDDGDRTDAAARQAVRDAIRAQHDTLLTLLPDQDDWTCASVVAILVHAVRGDRARTASYVQTLSGLVSADPEEERAAERVAAVAALDALCADEPAAVEVLRTALGDPEPLARRLAALALLTHDGLGSPAWEIVRSTLDDPGDDDDLPPAVFGVPNRYDRTWRICQAGAEVAGPMLPELLGLLLRSNSFDAIDQARSLIATFFPDRLPPVPDAAQAAVAATLAQHVDLRGIQWDEHFRGLPTQPRALRSYAARGPQGWTELVPARPARSPEQVLADLDPMRSRPGYGPSRMTNLHIGDAGSNELLGLLPPAFPALLAIQLEGDWIGTSGLRDIAALPALRTLKIGDCILETAGAEAIADSATLVSLWLSDVDLADEALAALGSAASLKALDLRGCPVAGGGFAGFGHSPMEELTLHCEMLLDPAGIAAMATPPALRQLTLTEGRLTDRFASVANLAGLRELRLIGTDVGAPVPLSPEVEMLLLGVGTTLGPDALDSLPSAIGLRKLNAWGVQQMQPRHLDLIAHAPNITEVTLAKSIDATPLRRRRPELTVTAR